VTFVPSRPTQTEEKFVARTDVASDTHRAPAQAANAWRVLALLAAANVLNYYDRTLPAVLVEPIKDEFGLTDAHIGVLSASFIVIYAVVGIWLGRMADRRSRRAIMGWGLLVWSLLTAASAGAWSFASLVLVRLGVGIGESAYAPAANSTISDLFPPAMRSRAVAVFQLGIPIGLTLAFFTTGLIADAFDSWRAPFLVAAVPGILLAFALFRIREPERGAADDVPRASAAELAVSATGDAATKAVWAILRIRTMQWLIFSGIGLQVAAYSLGTFLVPLLQRYYDLSLTMAAVNAGIVLGLAGLVGLLLGGVVGDRASRRSPGHRVMVGGFSLLASAPLTFLAFRLDSGELALFMATLSVAWLLQFFFHTTAFPAVADVVPAACRSTAMGVMFAAFYLLGGAFGPIATGLLSDLFAEAGHGVSAEAYGLHTALLAVVPASILLGAIGLIGAATSVNADHERMRTAGTPRS
jgi:MFS family permease